ncbi:unnamed protein product [Anisakis simplex]|uniref:DIOX_N domain-containing protein n=1 Tax=Anisakis simplex TaxID=6269 RepID=A0A0M3J479_ANISI|nr:unnamed protein product [Anisakis simplex]VDK22463.1 unnamed protein product [Anisakis simplex]
MLSASRLLINRALQARPQALAAAGYRLIHYDCFADRHIGPSELEKRQMLDYLGFKASFDGFIPGKLKCSLYSC